MSSPANAEVATIFEEMAAILEITGANPFRVNAYTRAARELRDLADDVAELAKTKSKLVKVEGIGKATAEKIIEYLETGAVARHQELKAAVPIGLLDVLRIPGLGPKTVQTLWKQADVTGLDTLRAKLDDGSLEALPRMGAKTIANIRDAMSFVERSSERVRLGKAMPLADAIVEGLSKLDGVTNVCFAGSLRRGRDTIGDVDILACATDPDVVAHAFTHMGGVTKVLVSGSTKCSVRLDAGVQVDLRLVPEASWGAALMYFTGSKQHNVRLRERAIQRGFRLNEYGLFEDDGEETPPQQRGVAPVASETEEDIYAKLELDWVPPELREDRGEIGEDVSRRVADLVTLDAIRSDLHTHTTASDGHMSIDELADLAVSRGLTILAVTDHSKSSVVAGGLDEERLHAHVEAVRAANAARSDITILAGSEVDILADGRLDYDDEILAMLDVVVASPHVALRQEPVDATARLLRAIGNPYVDIIGHPTGRVINKREGLMPDIRRLAEAAAENQTALEINSNSMRLDLRDTHVRAAVDAGALIAIDTDTHRPDQIEQLRYGVLTARRGWLPAGQCVNTWDDARLLGWLCRNRGKA